VGGTENRAGKKRGHETCSYYRYVLAVAGVEGSEGTAWASLLCMRVCLVNFMDRHRKKIWTGTAKKQSNNHQSIPPSPPSLPPPSLTTSHSALLEALKVTSFPLCFPSYFRFEGSVVGGVLDEREEEEEEAGVAGSGEGEEPIHRRSSMEGACDARGGQGQGQGEG